MKRRRLLVGTAGFLSASVASGTGAFTSTSANRDMELAVVHDDQAFLELMPQTGSMTRTNQNGVFQLLFDSEDGYGGFVDGDGVGRNSVYEFTGAATGDDRVFDIRNAGTNTVDVHATLVEEEGPNIELFDVRDESRTAIDRPANAVTLEPTTTGSLEDSTLKAGVRIITGQETDITTHGLTLQIRASES